MTNVLEPPESSNSISLVDGTVAEIGKALRQL